ncbi:MAG: hypothetical protein O3C27_04135 [Actinomycetota bacterium]|nr:hypothetical protein [Actinomycetota bacterium]
MAETFLGEDLLAWLVLAIGAALVAGNGLALFRPPRSPEAGALDRAPLGRTIVQIVVGVLASVWALATLFS